MIDRAVQVGEEKNNLIVCSPCDAIGDVAVLSTAVRKDLQVRILPGVFWPCDGIGKRDGLKNRCPKGLVGSNPTRAIEREVAMLLRCDDCNKKVSLDHSLWDSWRCLAFYLELQLTEEEITEKTYRVLMDHLLLLKRLAMDDDEIKTG